MKRGGRGRQGPGGHRQPGVGEQEIIEGLRPVCVCKGIRTAAVLRLIRSGKRTLDEVRRATGAGTGPCGGKQCTPRIRELLDKVNKEDRTSGGR